MLVAEALDKILLSRQACEQLGMISPSFPTVGSHDIENHRAVGEVSEIEVTEMNPSDEEFDLTPCSQDENGACTCPRREPTPPPPQFKLPQLLS